MIQPIELIDSEGITTTLNGHQIIFKFITSPVTKDLHELKNHLIFQEKQLNYLKNEVKIGTINDKIKNPDMKEKIKKLEKEIADNICNDFSNAFWDRKTHVVKLPYVDNFLEDKIPTKARPSQMDRETLEYCKKEISALLEKGLIRNSSSLCSYSAFYVNEYFEIDRGTSFP